MDNDVLRERLYKRTRRTDGCWVWIGAKTNGYGVICIGGTKTRQAHRVSWELENGPIPDGMCVCHHCDNPSCVRPDHLFLGTRADNNRDRDAKGRQVAPSGDDHWMRRSPELAQQLGHRLAEFMANHPELAPRGDRNCSRAHPERVARGVRQGVHKLTEDDVRTIRAEVAAGASKMSMARRFGVAHNAIRCVVAGTTWAHVK